METQQQTQGQGQQRAQTTYAPKNELAWFTLEDSRQYLASVDAVNKLTKALNNDKDQAVKFAQSVYRMVADSEPTGRDERALYHCDPVSIVNAAVTAASIGLPVDGRQLCYLIRRKNKVKLSIGYKGYVYKITEHNPTANIQVALVFPGDKFSSKRKNGVAEYTHIIKADNEFRSDYEKITGAYCYISYFIGKRFYADLEKVPLIELEQMRKKATTDNVWREWFGEQAKKSAARRASKLGFTQATAKLDAIDNLDYDLDRPVGIGHNSSRAGSASRLAERLKQETDPKGTQADKLQQPGEASGPVIDGTATEIKDEAATGGDEISKKGAGEHSASEGYRQDSGEEIDARSGPTIDGHARSADPEGDAAGAYEGRPENGQQKPVQAVRADEPEAATHKAHQGQAVEETVIDWSRTYILAGAPNGGYRIHATPELAYPAFLADMAMFVNKAARKTFMKDNRRYLDKLSELGHEAKVQFIYQKMEEGQ